MSTHRSAAIPLKLRSYCVATWQGCCLVCQSANPNNALGISCLKGMCVVSPAQLSLRWLSVGRGWQSALLYCCPNMKGFRRYPVCRGAPHLRRKYVSVYARYWAVRKNCPPSRRIVGKLCVHRRSASPPWQRSLRLVSGPCSSTQVRQSVLWSCRPSNAMCCHFAMRMCVTSLLMHQQYSLLRMVAGYYGSDGFYRRISIYDWGQLFSINYFHLMIL